MDCLQNHPFTMEHVANTLTFKGGMDDIRIYDNALSHEEIKQLYELEKPTSPTRFC